MTEKELKLVPKNKIGRVKANNVKLEAHEYETIYALASFGFDIEVIKPVNTPRSKNPDFFIGGTIWEAKSPDGGGNSTIARQFHKAEKQAKRLVLDLRRIKMSAKKSEEDARKRFINSRSIKHLILITKDGRCIDFSK